jgi:hypothetical protein
MANDIGYTPDCSACNDVTIIKGGVVQLHGNQLFLLKGIVTNGDVICMNDWFYLPYSCFLRLSRLFYVYYYSLNYS